MRLKKVLPVVKTKDGKVAPGLIVVARWHVNNQVALIAEKAGAKLFVLTESSGTHGAIITSRSLASTCCPGVTKSFAMRPETGA